MSSILIHHCELNAFECAGCRHMIEIPESVRYDPERLVIMRECLEADHNECYEPTVRRLINEANTLG